MIFSKKLIELREARQMTQYDLADAIGMSRTMISYWESAKGNNPTLETVEKIAEFFNVSPLSLLEGEKSKNGKTGPVSLLEAQVRRTKNLSTHKQKIIANMLKAFLDTN